MSLLRPGVIVIAAWVSFITIISGIPEHVAVAIIVAKPALALILQPYGISGCSGRRGCLSGKIATIGFLHSTRNLIKFILIERLLQLLVDIVFLCFHNV